MSIQAVSWVLDHSKSKGYARLVLIALANHANSESGECFPTQRTIAREAGISPGSVPAQIRELVDLGEVQILQTGGPRRSTRYQLTFAQELSKTDVERSAAEHNLRSAAERSARPKAERSARPRAEQNRHITVKEEEDSSTTSTSVPFTQAERWTRRWCEIRGVNPTRSVLKAWIPKVQEFIATGGTPSEALLEHAHRAGIETPGGWAFIAPDVVDAEESRRISEWMRT